MRPRSVVAKPYLLGVEDHWPSFHQPIARGRDGPLNPTWLVVGLPSTLYTGGSIRAGMIFADLCARDRVVAIRSRNVAAGLRTLAKRPELICGPTRLATARILPMAPLKLASKLFEPAVIDIHDHPVLQSAALGLPLSKADAERVLRDYEYHVATFSVLIAQTESFADLAGLPRAKTLIIPNGADPHRFRLAPMPATPTVGLVSGAAPGRGIELLIDAVREARSEVADLRLKMAISAPSEPLRTYFRGLVSKTAGDRWIEIVSLNYDEVPRFLEGVSIAAVPHPPGDYMDAVVPVKLFDSMMSGRPLVVTPRTETTRVVTTHDAGEVASGDSPSDLAEAIVRLTKDPERAIRLGRQAREAAISHYAWDVLSRRITDHMLAH